MTGCPGVQAACDGAKNREQAAKEVLAAAKEHLEAAEKALKLLQSSIEPQAAGNLPPLKRKQPCVATPERRQFRSVKCPAARVV